MSVDYIELRGEAFALLLQLRDVTEEALSKLKEFQNLKSFAPEEVDEKINEIESLVASTKNRQKAILSGILEFVSHDLFACVDDFQDWTVDLSDEKEGLGRLVYNPPKKFAKVTGEAMDILLELKSNAEHTSELQLELYSEYAERLEDIIEDMSDDEKDKYNAEFSENLDKVSSDGVLAANEIIKRFTKVFSADGFETFEDIKRSAIDFSTAEKGYVTIMREQDAIYEQRVNQALLDDLPETSTMH